MQDLHKAGGEGFNRMSYIARTARHSNANKIGVFCDV